MASEKRTARMERERERVHNYRLICTCTHGFRVYTVDCEILVVKNFSSMTFSDEN